jgi:toxin HigB-1
MIKSFKHKGLKRLYEQQEAKGVPAMHAHKIIDVFAALDTATEPQEVGLFPGWKLHALKGELKGYWSITISGNWRIIFRFEDGEAYDLDLIDYH